MPTPQTFQWMKQGRIFAPDGRHEWMQSHAQNPTILVLADRLRVYFTCRPKADALGRFASVTSFVDLDRANPGRVLYVHDRPILPMGESGTFDQFGVMPGAVLRVGSEVWLYYVGWSRCEGVPYNHAIGLAISRDDGVTFTRYGRGPVLTRTTNEPFIQNSPFAHVENGKFRMWYSSGTDWIEHDGRMESIYVLMYASSHDGIHWEREGTPNVPFLEKLECQTNPSVLYREGGYHMWFCHRKGLGFRNPAGGYRIGYARSQDGVQWSRADELSDLAPSSDGWDSEMVCYPRVVEVDGRLLMFYSGNYFGRDGFGYAIGH